MAMRRGPALVVLVALVGLVEVVVLELPPAVEVQGLRRAVPGGRSAVLDCSPVLVAASGPGHAVLVALVDLPRPSRSRPGGGPSRSARAPASTPPP